MQVNHIFLEFTLNSLQLVTCMSVSGMCTHMDTDERATPLGVFISAI